MSHEGAPKMPPRPFHWADWDNLGVPEGVTPDEYADALDYAQHWDLGVLWLKQSIYTKQES